MSEKNLSDKEFIKVYNSLEKSSDLLMLSAAIITFSCSIFILLLLTGEYVAACILAALASFISYMMIKSVTTKRNRNKAELGMSEEQASRRYVSIIENPIVGELYPIVQKVCQLNPNAQPEQEKQINGWYTSIGFDGGAYYETYGEKFNFNKKYDSSDFDKAIRILNTKSMSYRQMFVDKLFKLAVADDGIRDDEWNLLMDIMKQLNFNKNYFAFFIKRYGPLRMEFEEDEQGSNTSTENIPVSQLKAYFAVLGLEESASDEQIKKAYHNLVLQHHPDLPKNAGRVKECEELMKRFNEAHEKIRKSRIKK